jgi:hypothetical protein
MKRAAGRVLLLTGEGGDLDARHGGRKRGRRRKTQKVETAKRRNSGRKTWKRGRRGRWRKTAKS